LIAKGLAGKQMANLLGISPKTVEQHKTRIYMKLGVANQAEAVAVAGRETEGVAWVSSNT
jgi:DNA-binding CsgD family transcriptional regulator